MPTSTLNILVDQRFERSPDGCFWTHLPPAYPFFEKALRVFDRIRVIARVIPVAEVSPRARRVDGERVTVLALPCYSGIGQFLLRQGEIRSELHSIAKLEGSFLLRIPSQIGFMLASQLEALNKPYAVELLTDPWEFFAPGVASSKLIASLRPYFCLRSRQLCAQARVVNYVTGEATRSQNPASNADWSGKVSDVDLAPDSFCSPLPRASRPHATGRLEIVTVGFLDLLYKGQDLLLEAMAMFASNHPSQPFRLKFVGDGARRPALLQLAQQLGIAASVEITGLLGGPVEVRQHLQAADCFVLPSRAEGIPRALIEAMAASLPAIGTSVGAMPDLLDRRWIVPPASAQLLYKKIAEFAHCPDEWESIGRRNQKVARSFESSTLFPQRQEMYTAVRDLLDLEQLPTGASPAAFRAA